MYDLTWQILHCTVDAHAQVSYQMFFRIIRCLLSIIFCMFQYPSFFPLIYTMYALCKFESKFYVLCCRNMNEHTPRRHPPQDKNMVFDFLLRTHLPPQDIRKRFIPFVYIYKTNNAHCIFVQMYLIYLSNNYAYFLWLYGWWILSKQIHDVIVIIIRIFCFVISQILS